MTYFLAIFIYLFALIGVGVWKARKVKTQSDFAVAGRGPTGNAPGRSDVDVMSCGRRIGDVGSSGWEG